MAVQLGNKPDTFRQFALRRAAELKQKITPYIEKCKTIPTGLSSIDSTHSTRKKILNYFDATLQDWENWHWQMQNRITDPQVLKALFPKFPSSACEDIERVGKTFRWAVSPYYLSLMDHKDPLDPIRLQGLPSHAELDDEFGEEDPMGEAITNPAPCITRRYPDRLIINVTNMCAMYCRHCQRRRNIGETDTHAERTQLIEALDYIRANPEIRDVLVTGGDALLLSDLTLDWLLGELHAIPHVEIKRLGTRVPVTMPMRITQELCSILAKYPPLYINTQFNHPKEVTPDAKKAADKLVAAGVVLGNQAVLLKGINHQPEVMKKLNQELLKIRVRPYYIFHDKNVKGTRHFVPRIQDGLAVMEHLRGYTSGLAIPTYIINAPKGGGKTPILPQYLVSLEKNKATLRTWEGKLIQYETP
ncbi:glutamate 2,3-aminomutase [Desulfosporosinus metallidurans]|uniref:Lysine 2,3-aminomutase n=1 Tax=Desulfosporosinus metallidurans TaxID=1888891 RepID=A0A1Q8R0J3_9FIRM|nr:glutamate 2,3-aminomutase [Desulfosporosinus metallidurans]OLN33095.1 Lysine 2,3-aminomutase [Desulfosporosinus metallidurans]